MSDTFTTVSDSDRTIRTQRLNVQLQVVGDDPSRSTSDRSVQNQRFSALTNIAILGMVLLTAGIFVGSRLMYGWVPADEGTLGQSALRVLSGQLPHRDFTEIYTGGLSFLHALAFRVFGVNLVSLRICVFLFFLAWIPAVYYIALRFTLPLVAGAVSLLAAAWSFPNYTAAMPSWYNLFFATFGAAALFRYLEVKSRRWLFIAGLCGGMSILIKIIGLYYVAGCLLFFVFLEQQGHRPNKSRQSAIAYRLFTWTALASYLLILVIMIRTRLGSGELYHLLLPSVTIISIIVISDVRVAARNLDRFQSLFASALAFLGGVILPIALFLIPYARSRSVGALFSGVLGSAAARSVDLGVIRPLGIQKCVYGLVLAGLIACAILLRGFHKRAVAAISAAAFLALISVMTQSIATAVWLSIATATPIVVFAGAWYLITRRKDDGSTMTRAGIMLLLSLAATCTLVQYPFSAPIYLLYSLPLAILAAVAIIATVQRHSANYVLVELLLFLTAFAVVDVIPKNIYELTHVVKEMSPLQLERSGGLRVENAQDVEQLIAFLSAHSPNGLMYAGNNCPHLYFLSGLNNVTHDDGGAAPDDVLKALQSESLKLVVINDGPYFASARFDPELRAAVAAKFPESRQFGIFHVFWRN